MICGPRTSRDGQYCYPLTLVDHHSRYLLACAALPSLRPADTRSIFERVFCEVGLPAAIQSDNGTPFCSTDLHGLSALSVGWSAWGFARYGSSRATRSKTAATSGCTAR